ncbi:hypothetical protein JVU11DRAFT_503 [Chiua virens]|nr:hypothetical protein JVU11DRAFT_503 [Chiua virens]
MSFSVVVHDTLSTLSTDNRTKKRVSFLTCPKGSDAVPIPPSLVNSPYLSSPHSVFRRKPPMLRWPSQEDDEWLRDMVPINRPMASDADTRSEGSSNDTSPSPTSSDSSHGSLFPPPSLLRPHPMSPDAATPAIRAGCGSGADPSHR